MQGMTLLRSLVTALVLVSFAPCPTSEAQTREKYASIVIDADTGEVLHAMNADALRFPASLTKVMTLYMLFDELKAGRISLYEALPVSAAAAAQPPSKLGLRVGQTITVADAISALVTKSANDVAVVVAERLGGSEERFAALMTVKAKALGLSNTVFYNASGLPDARQVSTARDLAILGDAIFEDHRDYYDYFSTQRFSWGRNRYKNHNSLLGTVTGVDGIKTGYTRASGFNLLSSAKRGDQRIIAVVLGGRTARARDNHMRALIEAAYMRLDQRPAEPVERQYATRANDLSLNVFTVDDLEAVHAAASETGTAILE